VRYGNVPEAEALKFVTLNAAIQLGTAAQNGSLEVGKDADFVMWDGHPLSSTARVESTWIEGRKYYERAADQAARSANDKERARLIAKALPARLARLRAPASEGARADASRGTAATPNLLKDFFEYAALQRELHLAKQYRGDYWDGGQWHECTEDAR
jgi:hypothetical protein